MAVHRHEGSGGDIWIVDVVRDGASRLTFEPSQDNSDPVWSRDGQRVVFASLRNQKWGLYAKRADGTGSEQRLLESDQQIRPLSWSPDGNALVYTAPTPQGPDLWMLNMTSGKPVGLVQDRGAQSSAQISPDGRWIAYSSNESGRAEVYVRPFPALDGKWQVSTAGGTLPRWHPTSPQLYFLDNSNDGATVMTVGVIVRNGAFESGPPRPFFGSGAVNPQHGNSPNYPYAVAPDGKRFLVMRDPAGTSRSPITVVINWQALLER